jgi:predicted metalloprotease with PDZ domain
MAAQTVRYTVHFPAPHTHYVSIDAVLPADGHADIEVFMPVWTPGSYLVREYARNVESIAAADPAGKPLAVVKTRKNRWRISTGGGAEVRLSYRVYSHEMSVRTNWVEDSYALLNGAATFVTLVDGQKLAHDVRIELPPGWKTTMTGLPEAADNAPNHYLAPNYDILVDSPIVAGNPAVYRFEVDGVPHFLVNTGETAAWDGKRSAADLETIVRRYRDMWGGLPYRKYVFLNMITESTGGLEHNNSLCAMTNRWATSTRRSYVNWLDLMSHEFFHAWNIKRLRPVELGPFDYENENHTRSLWIAEGITDYYAPLTLRRTNLTTRAEYLGTDSPVTSSSLTSTISTLQTTPGRLVQSAAMTSYDAWIKLYRPDENSVNSTISYYTKGAAIGWLLDAAVRHATNGAKSLDDVMRLAYSRYSGSRGYTPEEFESTASEVAGKSLRPFFARSVESTQELDYDEALEWFGLRFKPENGNGENSGKAFLGIETRQDAGRLIITRIPQGTPAFDSGLSTDDEIIAIDNIRVRADQLSNRLENYKPGQKVTVLVARREELKSFPVSLGQEPKKWQLEIRPDASETQTKRLEQWIGK